MALEEGMLVTKGVRDVWAHWKGRYRTSEKRLGQRMEVVSDVGMLRYVERQVPRQVKSEGGELEDVSEGTSL
jgi:hypothetical protein